MTVAFNLTLSGCKTSTTASGAVLFSKALMPMFLPACITSLLRTVSVVLVILRLLYNIGAHQPWRARVLERPPCSTRYPRSSYGMRLRSCSSYGVTRYGTSSERGSCSPDIGGLRAQAVQEGLEGGDGLLARCNHAIVVCGVVLQLSSQAYTL